MRGESNSHLLANPQTMQEYPYENTASKDRGRESSLNGGGHQMIKNNVSTVNIMGGITPNESIMLMTNTNR